MSIEFPVYYGFFLVQPNENLGSGPSDIFVVGGGRGRDLVSAGIPPANQGRLFFGNHVGTDKNNEIEILAEYKYTLNELPVKKTQYI